MPVELIAQYLNIFVAIVLVVRLFWLGLAASYSVFTALLCFDIVSSAAAFLVPWHALRIDYRVAWLLLKPVAWILYTWVVYSILQKIMFSHRGILSVSRKVFACCFAGAIAIGIMSARVEFAVARPNAPVDLALVVERGFCTMSLLLLCATLICLLWFPISVSRNAALLCSGLMVYFAAKTALLLARDVWSPDSVRLVSLALILISTACLAMWAVFLTRAGEYETVRPGHSWKPTEQDRLLHELEAINAVLLRSVKQ
ncbi:MAG: hypothetical protein WAM39_14325 [Bryobacteraceae bacterium]